MTNKKLIHKLLENHMNDLIDVKKYFSFTLTPKWLQDKIENLMKTQKELI